MLMRPLKIFIGPLSNQDLFLKTKKTVSFSSYPEMI